MNPPRRPKPWAETNRQGRTRYVWRFQEQRYWTNFYDDPEEARADATTEKTQQIKGSWHERTGRRMLLEDWIEWRPAPPRKRRRTSSRPSTPYAWPSDAPCFPAGTSTLL